MTAYEAYEKGQKLLFDLRLKKVPSKAKRALSRIVNEYERVIRWDKDFSQRAVISAEAERTILLAEDDLHKNCKGITVTF